MKHFSRVCARVGEAYIFHKIPQSSTRAGDILVTYAEPGPNGKPVRRKEALGRLLARVEAAWRPRARRMEDQRHAM